MSDVTFTVPFVKGKGRARFSRRSGRAYTPTKTGDAMGDVQAAYQAAAGGRKAPRGVPVSVFIHTTRRLPKGRPKSLEAEPDVYRPDIDNVVKLVLDALNGVAWHDDTQVTHVSAFKGMRARDVCEETYVHVMWADKEEE